MISIIATSILMRIKGGFGAGPGKIISAVGFSALCYFLTHEWVSLLGGLGWYIGNKPSVGEILGAIGGYRGTWHKLQGEETKWTGWKQGVQRGVFTGACISLFIWDPAFIIAGSLFPIAAWVGISINQLLTGKVNASWYIFELIWGAAIGAAFLC